MTFIPISQHEQEKSGANEWGDVLTRLPKYVHAYIDRHGAPRHYLRRVGRKEVALPGLPWSTEFMDAYQAALNQAALVVIGAKRTKLGTVDEAVALYLSSTAFGGLGAINSSDAPGSPGADPRRSWRQALAHVATPARSEADSQAPTVCSAQHAETLRGFATFALEAGLIETFRSNNRR